jgi:hypothetical protein
MDPGSERESFQAGLLASASPVSVNWVATAPRANRPRNAQHPPIDAAEGDRRPVLRIRSDVVIRCILHHVRNLSLRDATVGVIDEQMLAVVLIPSGAASRYHE